MKMTLTFPGAGTANYEAEVESTADGLEIEGIGTIPWDWIESAMKEEVLRSLNSIKDGMAHSIETLDRINAASKP